MPGPGMDRARTGETSSSERFAGRVRRVPLGIGASDRSGAGVRPRGDGAGRSCWDWPTSPRPGTERTRPCRPRESPVSVETFPLEPAPRSTRLEGSSQPPGSDARLRNTSSRVAPALPPSGRHRSPTRGVRREPVEQDHDLPDRSIDANSSVRRRRSASSGCRSTSESRPDSTAKGSSAESGRVQATRRCERSWSSDNNGWTSTIKRSRNSKN